jgi:hypothetical protein
MHRTITLILATFALCAVAQTQAAESSLAPNAVPSTAGEFLSLIKLLADSGDITRPDEVARLLRMNLVFAPTRSSGPINSNDACAKASIPKNTARTTSLATYLANQDSWFKRRPEGVQIVRSPSVWGGPPGPIGDPEFLYGNAQFTRCAGRYAVTPEIFTTVKFENVPGFLCIRIADASYFTPERSDHATVFSYSGKTTEEYGTYVTVVFEQGCAVRIEVSQTGRMGLRTQRGLREFNDCVKNRPVERVTDREANTKFCAESIADY